MKKEVFIKYLLVVLLFIISISLSSCGKKIKTNSIISYSTSRIDDIEEKDYNVDKYEINEIPFLFLERLSSLDNYRKETSGETVAKGLFKYTQVIDNKYYSFNGEKHLITKSDSDLIHLYHEAFFTDSNVRYKDKNNTDFKDLTIDEYRENYGFLPYEYGIEGFILSNESIISIEKISNDEYQYKLTINGEIGSERVKIQMKKFGGFTSDPVFNSLVFIINIEKDFKPITIDVMSNYDVDYPILGVMNCTQEYRVTYYYKQ